jgi:hypothetical protein
MVVILLSRTLTVTLSQIQDIWLSSSTASPQVGAECNLPSQLRAVYQ